MKKIIMDPQMNDNSNHGDDSVSEKMSEFSKDFENSVDTANSVEVQELMKRKRNRERADAFLKVFAEYCSERLRTECEELYQSQRDTEIPETRKKRLDEIADRLEAERRRKDMSCVK